GPPLHLRHLRQGGEFHDPGGGLMANPKTRKLGKKLQNLSRRIEDRKSTRLNSSHVKISYAVFCLKKKNWNLPRGRRFGGGGFVRGGRFGSGGFKTGGRARKRGSRHSVVRDQMKTGKERMLTLLVV